MTVELFTLLDKWKESSEFYIFDKEASRIIINYNFFTHTEEEATDVQITFSCDVSYTTFKDISFSNEKIHINYKDGHEFTNAYIVPIEIFDKIPRKELEELVLHWFHTRELIDYERFEKTVADSIIRS